MGAVDREWAPGEVVGKHVIVRLLGEGGMARVYEARHRALPQRAAIKTLLPEFLGRAEPRMRFLREGRLAASMDHSHVIRILDVDTHNEVPYLVMEFLEGIDLAQHVAAYGQLSVEETVELLLPVLAGVQHAHDQGFVHRDLKPSNVMLARDANGGTRPVVLDFGIARALEPELEGLKTATNQLLGTPAYMSPELVRGGRGLTGAADQYALGAILYECVTGQTAFDGPNLFSIMTRIVTADFAPPGAGVRSCRRASRRWCCGPWRWSRRRASLASWTWARRSCPTRRSGPRCAGATCSIPMGRRRRSYRRGARSLR